MFAEPRHKNTSQLLSPQAHLRRQVEVGAKDDPQEKEADAVADSVMRQSENASQEEKKVQHKVSRETVARLLQRSADSQGVPVPRGPVMPFFQRKTDDNKVRDHDAEKDTMMRDYDGEAEKDDIMRTPGSEVAVMQDNEERIQRVRDEEPVKRSAEATVGEKGGAAPAAVTEGIQSSKGQGNPLPENVQQDIGGKMGADLGNVRIHTGSDAHEMSTAINAKAFTHGQDIYFKNGNYDPSSSGGKRLLAHELAHTQQSRGLGSGVNRKVQRNWLWTRMKNYAKSQVKQGMRSLPEWLQFYLSFQIGVSAGIIDWVKDLLVTAWNMSIFKFIYDLVWGDLISDMKELGNAIRNMTWDQFKEILSEVKSQIVGDVKAYWARMTSDDPQTSGYAWGWIIGYLIPEVVLIVITDGIYAGAKWGAKLLQWLGRLGTKIVKLATKGVKMVKKGVVKGWKAVKKGVRKGWQGVKKGLKKVVKFRKNTIPKGKAANHIFSGKSGKLSDTPANRRLITDLTNDSRNFLGVDKYGKDWYAKTLSNGTQLYGYTQNGIVKGAGINSPPINIFTAQGLK